VARPSPSPSNHATLAITTTGSNTSNPAEAITTANRSWIKSVVALPSAGLDPLPIAHPPILNIEK
jgi:hypothetical protein